MTSIKVGRPSKLTKEITQRIVDSLASGKTLTDTAKLVGIDITTIYRWSDENPTFHQVLTRAHHHQAKALVDQSIELLENTSRDIIDGPKGPVINNAQVHRDKARVELRLRLAGIYNPMYAERKDNNTVNIQVNNTVDAPRQETRAEWLARQAKTAPQLPGPGTQVLDESK